MIHPMLCQTGKETDLNREGWVGEIKFDGTRAILIKTDGSFAIQNRRGVDYTKRLPEITMEAKDIDETFILDGEICYFNSKGISEFTPCQRRCSTQNINKIHKLRRQFPVIYVAFDILMWNNENYRKEPYWARKELLENFLFDRDGYNIDYAEHSEEPHNLLKVITNKGGEGIILKKLNSRYYEGVRSYDWLKIRPCKIEVCDVVGYTEGNNRRSDTFGALVLSQNEEYVGKCGGGYSDSMLRKITAMLTSNPSMRKPFDIEEPYTAVKTKLKIEVKYFEKTESGVMRFPTFNKLVDNHQSTL